MCELDNGRLQAGDAAKQGATAGHIGGEEGADRALRQPVTR
jgi:hypothetical protein